MWRGILIFLLLGVAGCQSWPTGEAVKNAAAWDLSRGSPAADAQSDRVLVVVNDNSPGSVEVGTYYQRRRGIPPENVCHIRCPVEEEIVANARWVFLEQIKFPIERYLAKTLVGGKPLKERIRYLVTTYGVPLKGLHGPRGSRANFGVDGELCLLFNERYAPQSDSGPDQAPNPYYLGVTRRMVPFDDSFRLDGRPVYLVCRLDGPSPEDVKALVDRAIRGGDIGDAYIDLDPDMKGRGYDEANAGLQEAAAVLGSRYHVTVESTGHLFTAARTGLPALFYAGWYAGAAPYTRGVFTWAPGAVGYHITSYSAATVRSRDAFWCGPMIHDGITATLGAVYEPYITYYTRPQVFFASLLKGRNFAESAYSATPALSWMMTFLGDPLYRLHGPASSERK